jgi:hypothetical protein
MLEERNNTEEEAKRRKRAAEEEARRRKKAAEEEARRRAEAAKKKQDRIRIKDRTCARRAGVTTRTLRRWEVDPRVGYPQADVILGRRYRWLDEVEAWEELNPGFGKPGA